jgi:hypothetical protein
MLISPLNTSILVVAGEAGSGKSTFIEALFSMMQSCASPTLWMDATADCGILRKLKGEASLKSFQGVALVEALREIRTHKWTHCPELDWHLAETPYPIIGVHDGLSLQAHSEQASEAESRRGEGTHRASDLLEDPCVEKALAYGWPRLLAKHYRYVVMNAHEASLVKPLLPKLQVSLLYLCRPKQGADFSLLKALEDLGPWHSLNVLMTQASPRDTLESSWQNALFENPSWRFLGRLPYFKSDADWHQQYQDHLRSILTRLNWDGVSVIQR